MTPFFDKAIVSATFIGRITQLGALDHWLAQVGAGQRQVVCVTGEAGIGKSRLVAEVWTRAAARGWQTVQGACFEPDLLLPYAPLIDLLRTYLANHSRQEVQSVLDRWAPEFVKLLPELALLRPGVQPTVRLDPEAEKRRLFDAFVHFLNDLSQLQSPLPQLRPLLVIIEDLHWCDDTSLEFLRYLARRMAKRPLFLLLTYRSDEIQPTLHHFLAALDREQRPVELTLPRFTRAEVDALLRAIFALQRPVRAAFLDALHTLTEGNPFFIEEVLKALVAAGDIFYQEGEWDRKPLSELQIPRTVQSAVQRRTEQLSLAARRLLNLAAVAGRRFDFALLQALTGHDEAVLLALMKEVVAAQLVVEATPEQFAFRHALTQQAIYAGLLARERKSLHRTIAETTERRYGPTAQPATNSGQAPPWAALAHHFYVGEVWDKALLYAQRAGEQAQILHAPHAAVEHFTHALTAVQHLAASTAAQPDTAVVMRLHSARGLAYETLGDFEAARTDLGTALHLAQRAADPTAEWYALLALGELWASRNYRQTGEYLRQALDLARAAIDPTSLAQSLNRVGNWYVNIEEPNVGLRYHQEALTIFRALDDQAGLAATFDLIALAHFVLDNKLQSAAHLERAIALFRQLDEPRGLSSCLALLAAQSVLYVSDVAVLPSLSIAESLQRCELALQTAREIGWRAGEAHALFILGRLFATTGEYTRALTIAQQGLGLAIEIGHSQWLCQLHITFGLLYLDVLALPAARQHFEQALVSAQETGSLFLLRGVTGFLALTCILQHDLGRAEAVINMASDTELPPQTAAQKWVWIGRAELALASGDAQLAFRLAEQLITTTPNIEQTDTYGVPRLALLEGRVLAALVRPGEAEIALQHACAGAATKGLPSLLWRAQVALGNLYLTQGRQEEADHAYTSARTILEELAAKIPDEPFDLESVSLRENFLHQTSALFSLQPRRTPRQAAKQAFGGLTAREVDVAIQLAQGKTNREVSAALVISERTVETHVGNILAKLGFSSRHQIAAWAMEKGLVNANGAKP